MIKKETSLSEAFEGETDREKFDKNIDERLVRLAKAKSIQLSILQYLKESGNDAPHIKKLITNLQECGSYLVFRNYYLKNVIRLLRANFCQRHLICPLCAIRRGAKLLFQLLKKDAILKKENPNLENYMLTLTVKNGMDLEERFHHLAKSVTRLVNRRNKQIKRGKIISEFSKIHGGCGSYEVTYNVDHGWHPHVHFVIYLEKGEKINKQKFIKEWKEVTKDSFIIDVRKMDDTVKSFLEVVKYALKFSSLPYPKLFEAFNILKGKNLFRSFGILYGLKFDEDLEDDISDMELEPYVDMIYRYLSEGGYQLAEIRDQDPNMIN